MSYVSQGTFLVPCRVVVDDDGCVIGVIPDLDRLGRLQFVVEENWESLTTRERLE